MRIGGAWGAATGLAAIAATAAVLASMPGEGHAQLPGTQCLSASPPAVTAPAQRLRFGITPLAAGTAGVSQAQPKTENPALAQSKLQELRSGNRYLILRLNRMQMADGEEGVRRYAALVNEYAKAGFDTELQIRYHPAAGQEGDMAAWESYVRLAVSILGKRPSVKAFTITNEANFPVSPNTSDGSFPAVRQAIVTGTLAARDELDRMGRPDVKLGFSFAWRWLPDSDAAFWRDLGAIGNAAFRQATDYVGVQIYPGLVWPPAPLPGRSAGDEITDALTLLRGCYMPMAGLGRDTDLWVTENGYPTNLGRTEASQDADLTSSVESIYRYSGTLGVTDYRWFNLRDNNTTGTDLFAAVGLLRDDYSEKPAFRTFRSLLERYGTDQPPERRCGNRVAVLLGTAGRDRIRGSVGPDVIYAGAGADRVKAGRGADLVCGGPGRDRLAGGRGRDRLIGGPGRDRCRGGSGRDRISGC